MEFKATKENLLKLIEYSENSRIEVGVWDIEEDWGLRVGDGSYDIVRAGDL